MSADEIKATLAYLVPGFVALKVFYVLGLRTRRTDFDWTILSIATAAVLNYAIAMFGVTDPLAQSIDALGVGIVVAAVGAWVWRRFAAHRWGRLFERQAWDAAFDGSSFASVWIKDGPVVLGWPKTVSESAEADDQDLLVTQPAWVDRSTGAEHPMTGAHAVWIPASQIEFVQLLDPGTPATNAPDTGR